jgi:hypothetical protein
MVPPPPWEIGLRKEVARIGWTCRVETNGGQVRQLAGTFNIFTGPKKSFAQFNQDDSRIFLGRHPLQSDERTWFLPDVSIDHPDGYCNAAFNFRTNLARSDRNSGFIRLSRQRTGDPSLEKFASGPCSKNVIFKVRGFERMLMRYGAGA